MVASHFIFYSPFFFYIARSHEKFSYMNPFSLSSSFLEVQKQKDMYKETMFPRMRAHPTLLKNNKNCEVTSTTDFSH